jgi:hypothetical protein
MLHARAMAFDTQDAQHHPEIGVLGFENDSPRQARGYMPSPCIACHPEIFSLKTMKRLE